jgi:hypothetical protein
MNAEAEAWREWLLSLFQYVDWREITSGIADPSELPDERLRGLFAFSLGYTMAGFYQRARSRVVRELAELEKK